LSATTTIPVDTLEAYIDEARRLTPAAFEQRHGGLFLLKRPTGGEDGWDQDIDFQTSIEAIDPIEGVDLSLDPAFEQSWRVSAVRKRPGNPFPDRISVGRTRNCDVVLRLSHESKLHAHIVRTADGKLGLIDSGSANGTRVNGSPCSKGVVVHVAPGDHLQFGLLEVDLVDAAMLHRQLLSPTRP
jgi:hypothetical protein